MIKKSKKLGFTLLEMVVYAAISSVILFIVVESLSSVSDAYKHVKVSRDVNRVTLTSMGRIVQEIRDASSVDVLQSSFGVSNGALALVTEEAGGGAITSIFSIVNGKISLSSGGVVEGSLTDDSVSVGSLRFDLVGTTTTSAVSIELEISSGTSTYYRAETFRNSAVLRGSYRGR